MRTWTESVVAEAAQIAVQMADAGAMNRRQKPDGSTVTDIDQAVERFLRDALAKQFPHHAVLGEEFGREASGSDPDAPLWAIDPVRRHDKSCKRLAALGRFRGPCCGQ